ncbi:MAG TPA: hypothetical protein VN253_12420 [Kofleriaceae bacterium]|nr:hypothetical protein [Kofleriaceae bacterium]
MVLILGVAAQAAADPKKPGEKPKPIDAKKVADKLDVYRDDAGMYYVSPKPNAFDDNAGDWVFFGDGKTMYQQRIVGFGSSGKGYDWTVWSPRVKGLQQASLTLQADKPYAQCTQKDKKPLAQLTVDEAKALFQRATFLPPLWQRQAHFLARDDDGTYFFVDRYQDDYGGKGYRVFSGQKGAMKELAMTNVVSDSAGEIYATKSGDLKIVTEGDSGKAYWKKGQTKNELIVLELFPNRYLIYRELGIYGQLGVVCDDQ